MQNIGFNRNIISVPSSPINNNNKSNVPINNQSTVDFKKILEQKLNQQEVVFSKHAMQRIDDRNIDLSPQMITKINDAVNKAMSKGVKDALILSDEASFIVNISSKTVITALSSKETKDNVFTNIDGTVII